MAIRTESLQTYFFLALVGLFAFLSYLLIRPYLLYIATAIVLVYLAYPLYRQIGRIVEHESLAALLAMVLLLLIAVVPTIILADMIVNQARNVLVQVGSQTAAVVDTTGIETEIADLIGRPVDVDAVITQAFSSAGTFFSERLPGLITTFLDAVIGITVMAITMFYLFRDGDTLVRKIQAVLPIDTAYRKQLFNEVDTMAQGILLGHVLTATAQGVIAGIGLWLVGIPNVIFWTFIMILLGIIPLIGNVLVWGPAGLYLIFLANQPVPGILLLIYESVMMIVSDNLIRAQVVGRRAHIHPLVVMIGVVGGLPLFGLLGVVLGPLTLGIFLALLRVYQQEFGT